MNNYRRNFQTHLGTRAFVIAAVFVSMFMGATLMHTDVQASTDDTYCFGQTIQQLIDSGKYTIFDHRTSNTSTTINGTSGMDLILASEHGDTINAKKGHDCIIGGAGDDKINAGRGVDVIYSMAGNDTIHPGKGADMVHCGDGSTDRVTNAEYKDVIYDDCEHLPGSYTMSYTTTATEESEPTYCFGQTIQQLIDSDKYELFDHRTNNTSTTINGTSGMDLILASEHGDTINAKKGDDCIIGGAGGDIIFAGAGVDVIYSMAGNDAIQPGKGTDMVHCGDGFNDTVSFVESKDIIYDDCEQLPDSYTMSYTTTATEESEPKYCFGQTIQQLIDSDKYATSNIFDKRTADVMTTINATSGNDLILASEHGDTIYGNAGDDCIIGGAGGDIIFAGAGVDVIYSLAGDDMITTGDNADTVHCGDGLADTVLDGTSDDTISADCGMSIPGLP